MKHFLTIILFLLAFGCFCQNVPEMNPLLGELIDKSAKGEINFLKEIEECEAFSEKYSFEEIGKMSQEKQDFFDNCLEGKEDYWEILGAGCSWYCGGGLDTLSTSSSLKSFKKIKYSAFNAHDLNYKTAWVEGVDGYGIGEFLMYHFPPESPRITKIIIINGYVKSEKTWRENSRVKKLKMYLNDELFAILNLKDSREKQEFSFKPIGNSEREDFAILKTKPWWTMKFEIAEVYEGEKYDDTAITEIYFDGIDVH